MRKRWLWVLGCIALFVAALYAVLVLIPPVVPFKFLHGQRPIRFEDDGINTHVLTWYSVEANSKEVAVRARRELESLGFGKDPLRTEDNVSSYLKPPRKSHWGPTREWWVDVYIVHDTQAPVEQAEWKNAVGKSPGWTTVAVRAPRPKADGLLDKLRAWLGM